MEYYSAIKKNEILSFSTMWMNLEDIILSEISQTEEDKYCMLSLYMESKNKMNDYNKTETDSQRTN